MNASATIFITNQGNSKYISKNEIAYNFLCITPVAFMNAKNVQE